MENAFLWVSICVGVGHVLVPNSALQSARRHPSYLRTTSSGKEAVLREAD